MLTTVLQAAANVDPCVLQAAANVDHCAAGSC